MLVSALRVQSKMLVRPRSLEEASLLSFILDTFALFGSISLMIQKGMTINPDGSFLGWNGQPGVPLPKRALNVIKKWFRFWG